MYSCVLATTALLLVATTMVGATDSIQEKTLGLPAAHGKTQHQLMYNRMKKKRHEAMMAKKNQGGNKKKENKEYTVEKYPAGNSSKLLWTASFTGGGINDYDYSNDFPIIDGVAYVTGDDRMYAIDTKTGSLKYQTSKVNHTMASGASCGRSICVTMMQSQNGLDNNAYFVAYHRHSGSKLWTIERGMAFSSPVVIDAGGAPGSHRLGKSSTSVSGVLVGFAENGPKGEGGVQLVSQKDGSVVWYNENLDGGSPVDVDGNTLYTTGFDSFYAVNLTNGKQIWKSSLNPDATNVQYASGVCRNGDKLFSTGQTKNDNPYISSVKTDGTSRWGRDVKGHNINTWINFQVENAVCGSSNIYFVGDQLGYSAVSQADGTLVWREMKDGSANTICTSTDSTNPFYYNGNVFVPCTTGYYAGQIALWLVGLDGSSGSVKYNQSISTAQQGGKGQSDSVIQANSDGIYVYRPSQGTLMKFSQ